MNPARATGARGTAPVQSSRRSKGGSDQPYRDPIERLIDGVSIPKFRKDKGRFRALCLLFHPDA